MCVKSIKGGVVVRAKADQKKSQKGPLCHHQGTCVKDIMGWVVVRAKAGKKITRTDLLVITKVCMLRTLRVGWLSQLNRQGKLSQQKGPLCLHRSMCVKGVKVAVVVGAIADKVKEGIITGKDLFVITN